MALYHKYRPQSLDEMYGNKSTIHSLRADLAKQDKPHAFLIVGPTGAGKTSLARIIAKELGSSGGDLQEVNSADMRGIDTIREIRRQSDYKPMESECRTWILDELHQWSKDAATAMLKLLEDPPSHTYFVLATTDPQKLLPTLKGRCAQYAVSPLSDRDMYKLLKSVSRSEGESVDPEVIEQIVMDSQGLPRNALQILDQVLAVEPDVRLEVARQQAERQSAVIELCRALLNRNGWRKVSGILRGLKGDDPEKIRRAVLGYCSAVLLKSDSVNAAFVMEQFREPTYNNGFNDIVFACYSCISVGR